MRVAEGNAAANNTFPQRWKAVTAPAAPDHLKESQRVEGKRMGGGTAIRMHQTHPPRQPAREFAPEVVPVQRGLGVSKGIFPFVDLCLDECWFVGLRGQLIRIVVRKWIPKNCRQVQKNSAGSTL